MKLNFNPILIAILLMNFTIYAQQRVALHSVGVTTIYAGANPFVDAYNASVNGDTIYLSGGGFISPANLNKGLTIIGAGFHPDSTTATYPTFFSTTDIFLGDNADNLHIEGLQFTNLYKSRSYQVNNLTIKRCKMSNLQFSYDGTPVIYSVNLGLLENIIINLVNLSGINNSIVSNNILQGQINDSYNNNIQNNILLFPTQFGGNYNNVYKNNIFSNTNGVILTTSNGNVFEKNIFTTANPNFDAGSVDDNNYKSVNLTTVYVNQTGHTFNYTHNYHLKPAAVLTYLGSDGSQVGIFGGLFPYKEGAVPLNPHIQFKNIAPQTDVNGDLNIQLKVNAQSN